MRFEINDIFVTVTFSIVLYFTFHFQYGVAKNLLVNLIHGNVTIRIHKMFLQ